MKKGLSVLLIAAALFGFYGGAVNLNDILDCKDYWEEAGEKSTADMNKLEDGLNQLKDNEQAYLDGLDQVEEGEAALAEGEATLAKGEADYAAAPGKLKAGEQQLAEGEDSYADLQRLIKGLKTARKHGTETTKTHDTYWHDAFTNALRPGRKQIVEKLGSNAAMIGTLASDPTIGKFINNEASYPNFDSDVKKLIKAIPTASAALKQYAAMASGYATDKDLAAAATALKMSEKDYKAYVTQQVVSGLNGSDDAKAGLSMASGGAYTEYTADIVAAIADESNPLHQLCANETIKAAIDKYTNAQNDGLDGVRDTVASQVKNSPLYKMKDMLSGMAASNPELAGLIKVMDALVNNNPAQPNTLAPMADGTMGYSEAITAFQGGLGKLSATLSDLATQLDGGLADLQKWDAGYKTLADAKDASGSDDLASKSEGIPFAFNSMLTNKTLKSALKKYDKKLIKELKKYKGDRLKNDSMTEFDDDLTYISNTLIPRSLKVLAKVKASAAKQLADGRKQLAQGRKDYAEAPAKLAEGRQQLADGRAQLAAGKDQLAQYEDGEQQVRDGLATLVGTEPDLELESILDRLNGDSDFDNGDEHLDLDEGLAAVEVGRGYQAEDGELITKEIMTRAIGTGGLLAAGVLAVLAALLSFMKKNKGAGVCAILAAAAGAFGAFEATQAGTYFSNIAGSTVGQTGLYAAGALAVVALVHAIAHFTAKKEA